MYSLGDIVVKLKANTADLEAGLDRAGAKTSAFGKGLGVVGAGVKAVAATLVVGGAAAAAFGALSVKAYSESENRLAQLQAVLKSTGGVAGVTSEKAIELSKALQKVTKFSDEDVLSVENMLLTFTKINKNIFPQATETVLNMATALGEDTKSASIQLGKALQDPILGITALRRVGVNFNDDQKKVIENLVNTGHSAEAQAMILKELQTEFGGSARAAGDTFAGKLAKLKNSLNDVEETIGHVIVNGLAPFATKALNAIASVDWEKIINKTVKALGNLWKNYLLPILKTLDDIAKKIADYLEPKVDALWSTITNKLIPALKEFWQRVLLPIIPTIGEALVGAVGFAIDALNFIIRAVADLVNALAPFKTLIIDLAEAFIVLRGALFIWDLIAKIQVGFETLRLVTIPSLIATITGPVGIIAALALVGVALFNYANSSDHSSGSAWALKQANDGVKDATDKLKQSEDQLANSRLAKEGADLAVERAQRNYNDAVSRFGPASLEARQALHDLKQAQEDVKEATQRMIDKQAEFVQRSKDLASAKNNVQAALEAQRAQVQQTRDKWFDLNSVLDNYTDKIRKIQNLPQPKATIPTTGTGKIPGFASGIENFGGGLAYVHAGEMLTYLPKGSNVTPANQVSQKFGNTIAINGDINIDSPQDADYFFKRIDRNSQLEGMGLSPLA